MFQKASKKEEAGSLVALRKSESEYQPDIGNVYVAALQAQCTYFEELAKAQCKKVRVLEEKVLPGGVNKDLQAMDDTLRSENIKAMAKLSAREEKRGKSIKENSRLVKENSLLEKDLNRVRELFEKMARDTKRDRSFTIPSLFRRRQAQKAGGH